MMTNHNSFINNEAPWDKNNNPVWLASTLRLNRNIEKFNFPGKLSTDKRKQIVSLISKELLNEQLLNKPTLHKSEDLPPIEKEFLYEHHLSPRSFHEAQSGEGFLVDTTGQFLATINLFDHIQMQLTDTTGEIENTWTKLSQIESNLGKNLNYSFSPRFGYLTSNANECGTAFIASIFLHLPALIHTNKLKEYLDKHHDDAISLTGIQGKPNELIGDIVSIHNNYTLGISEENVISALRGFSAKLILDEQSIRKDTHLQNNTLKDKVSRAYGILIHSYQIGTIEAFNAISLLKLGTELGWVDGVDIQALNKLLFNIRRAHLVTHFEDEVSQDEINHRRAEFIHRYLKETKLHV